MVITSALLVIALSTPAQYGRNGSTGTLPPHHGTAHHYTPTTGYLPGYGSGYGFNPYNFYNPFVGFYSPYMNGGIPAMMGGYNFGHGGYGHMGGMTVGGMHSNGGIPAHVGGGRR